MEGPTEEQSQLLPNEAVEIVIPEKLCRLRENYNLGGHMQKVPPLLRLDKNNQQDYDPLVVSLGPYHHGKKELQSAEDFKLVALEMFVADSGHDALFFYSKVLQRVNDARNCYFKDSTTKYDDETFAQMMLIDACFIINAIISCSSAANFCITRHCLGDLVSAIVFRDMFLLENQIPFWLLKLLIRLRYGDEQGEKTLDEFLNETVFGEYRETGEKASRPAKGLPLHLLGAFWQLLVSESPQDKPFTPKSSASNESGWVSHFRNVGKCSKLYKYVSNSLCFLWRRRKIDNECSTRQLVHSFRSVMELKAKGIHFRPSSANSLMGIKFTPSYFYATLEIPVWFVSIYTKVFFLNMIAYEMCPRTNTNRSVAAYVEFMKSLIDDPKDVKELREKRILLTTLGSDVEVVKVYKEINTYGVKNITIFHGEEKKIQYHYNNKANTWLAELFHIYFRSPWTVIALFAATLLLVLTFLQTYYTVKRS